MRPAPAGKTIPVAARRTRRSRAPKGHGVAEFGHGLRRDGSERTRESRRRPVAGNRARGKAQCAPLTPAAASPSVPPVMNSRWIALAAAAAVAALAALAATGDDADAQARLNFDDFPMERYGFIVTRAGHWLDVLNNIGEPIDIVFPSASGGRNPINYNLSPLPAGLEFDRNTRRLSGIPTEYEGDIRNTGQYFLTYEATDAARVTAKVIITLWVNAPIQLAGTTTDTTTVNTTETSTYLDTLNRNIRRAGSWYENSAISAVVPAREENIQFQFGSREGEPEYPLRRYEGYTFTLNTTREVTIKVDSDLDTEITLARASRSQEGSTHEGSRILAWSNLITAYSNEITLNLKPARYWLVVGGGAIFNRRGADGWIGSYALRISSPDFDRIVPTAGRIVLRRHDSTNNIEFRWLVDDTADEVLPALRFLPDSAPSGRWFSSSDVIYKGFSLGRINVRVNGADNSLDLAFTPSGGERIASNHFHVIPSDGIPPRGAGLWMSSAVIEWNATSRELNLAK